MTRIHAGIVAAAMRRDDALDRFALDRATRLAANVCGDNDESGPSLNNRLHFAGSCVRSEGRGWIARDKVRVKSPPNVLIFCADEMRADHMGCAGNRIVRTPNIDRIAGAGTVFNRAYCNNPICMPARSTMFTGLLPRDHGVRINGQNLRTDLPVLPDLLRRNGYRTHAAGKLHLTAYRPLLDPPDIAAYPESIDEWNSGLIREFPVPYYGFESVDFVGGHTEYAFGAYIQWLEARGGDRSLLTGGKALARASAPQCYKMSMPAELHYNRYIADSAIRVVNESAAPGSKPFFIWCSFPDPHVPVAPPAPYCDMYDPASIPLPVSREGEHGELPRIYGQMRSGECRPNGYGGENLSALQYREMIALTYGMITHMDSEIGRVLDALEAAGQRSNTIILFLSDHGDMMGDHSLLWKSFFTFEGCIRIPFVASAPGMASTRTSDALIAQVDLMPSILDLCGIALPGIEWKDRKCPFDRGAVRPLQLYPGRSWKTLLGGQASSIRDAVVIENDDPTTGYQVRCLVTPRYRLTVYPGTDEGELFDLQHDRGELHNLWNSPAHHETRGQLTAQLLSEYSLATPYYPIPPWNS